MTDKELVGLLRRAHIEVDMLRKQIAILEPQAHAYRVLSTVVGMLPEKSQAMGIDVAWELRRAIEDLNPDNPPAAAVD